MLELKKSKSKIITGCNYSKTNSYFVLEYVTREKDGTTYVDSDGVEKDSMKKVFTNLWVKSEVLFNSKEFAGKSEKEICQAMIGKSFYNSSFLE